MNTAQAQDLPPVAEPGLIELLTFIGEEKARIAKVAALVTAVALIVSLLLPVMFSGKTVLLPPQQSQSGSGALLASLGGLAGFAGGAAGLKTPEELYVGLLKTETVANALIERFKLQTRYDQDTLQNTRKELATRTKMAAERKSGLITLEVEDTDPTTAALLANAYAEELRKLTNRLAVTEAQQRRQFYDQQLAKNKADLTSAELAYKQAQSRSGLVSLDAQTQTAIGNAAQVRGLLLAREVQLQAMRPYTGPDNPDMRRLLSELDSLRSQLVKLEGGVDGRSDATNPAALANLRAYRELKYQEAMQTALQQQMQLARLDEARDAPWAQQVDVAAVPEKKSRPKRALIVLGGAFLGLLLGLAWVFVSRALKNAHEEAESAQALRMLRRAWAIRRSGV